MNVNLLQVYEDIDFLYRLTYLLEEVWLLEQLVDLLLMLLLELARERALRGGDQKSGVGGGH